ncbi:MAG TPA: PP2C family protein-serine/threonine phosphatase [Acidobacteriaceae bacterium]|nr:PP2C family protein-serine/threonine phosphatase [Acidobacteriaceae bacterium]
MRKLVFSLLLLAAALPLCAQSFDASQWNQGVTTIDSLWRFHPGDNPAWASPSFDDSSWPLLATGQKWGSQGYPDLTGYAWYRLRLKLPATTQPLDIDIGHVNSTSEVYADGRLLGENGVMRPRPDWSDQQDANAFPLPLSCNGHWVEIAVRVWKSPVASSYSSGGFWKHPVVGSLPLLQTASRVAFDDGAAGLVVPATVQLFTLVLGFLGLGLFLLDRRSTEYAWLALWAIGSAALFLTVATVELRQGSVTFVLGDAALLALPLYIAENLFLWGFLRARLDRLFWAVVLLNIVAASCYALAFHAYLPLPVGQAVLTVADVLVFALVIARVLLSLRAGSFDARLLLLPIVLQGFEVCIDGARQAIYYAGLSHTSTPLILWSNGIVEVDWSNLFDLLNLITIAAVLILRFTRSAQEEKRLATELASARAVQDRLVPAQLPLLPGLHLDATYLPATEVGGDFYQVFPQGDGSALVVIGDVSGKGLKAAMTGTLVLGALRSLAQDNLSPAQTLFRLNAQLATSSDLGFVTCLCARIAADGKLTLANAGHLPPYRNGEELPLDSGLPLGITPDTTYAESTVQLAPSDRLTFLSDGVAEAQAASGQLFGFDRTRAISTQSAEAIAHAAQSHGQQDDITVLTLTFAPAEVLRA